MSFPKSLFKGISLRSEGSETPGADGSESDGQRKAVCATCPRKLHKKDTHFKCYECLGPYHKVNACGACAQLSSSARYKRKKAINYYFQHNVWPKSLESMDSEGSFKTAVSKQTQNTQEVHEIHEVQVHQENLPESQDADQVDENNEQIDQNMVADIPQSQEVEEGQNDDDVVELDQEVEEEVQPLVPHMSDEIRKKFEEFMKSQEQSQSQKKSAPKRPGTDGQGTPAPKNPRVDISKDPVITHLQSQVSNVDQKLQLILSKLSGPDQQQSNPVQNVQNIPITQNVEQNVVQSVNPIQNINQTQNQNPKPDHGGARPKVVRSVQSAQVPLRLQDLDSQVEGHVEEYELEEDQEEVEKDPYEDIQDLPTSEENLSRRAARDMWLVALPEVCPDAPVPKEERPSSKNKFFKTLKQKKEHPIMPFIPEVSDFCVGCDKNKLSTTLKSVETFYETEEHVEAQLLAIRSVPSAVSKEVPIKSIKESGASEINIRLNPKIKVGTQERLCLESARYAHSYVRLCNNFQLALASMEAQLEKCKLQADLLGSKPFSNNSEKLVVQEAMEDMISNFNIMSLAVKDLNTANGDFSAGCWSAISFLCSGQSRCLDRGYGIT